MIKSIALGIITVPLLFAAVGCGNATGAPGERCSKIVDKTIGKIGEETSYNLHLADGRILKVNMLTYKFNAKDDIFCATQNH